MKRTIIFSVLLYLTSGVLFCLPTDSTKNGTQLNHYERIKLRIGCNYNFETNYAKVELGIYRNDFPFSLHRTGEWGEIVNHNTFFSTELNVIDRFFLGPKLGYEFNCVFFQARLNMIDYFDFQTNNTFVFRPELGGTLFGFFSLSYGYNFVIYYSDTKMIKPHILSFTYHFY